MATYTDAQVEAFISAREAELRKKHKGTPAERDSRSVAAMEWDIHTGRIDRRDVHKGWKDPYAKLDKAAKAKPKTAKAKGKK